MKVNKVNYNISNQTTKADVKQRALSLKYTNFTGKINPADVSKGIDDAMPAFIRTMKKIGSNQGEVQNIIINALGTGLIAPIFIKWNPLSNTDEDTRTYSAWRQPVSAILAVVTQAGVTIPFNKVISNMANSGKFSNDKYNKTLFKDENYVRKLIKATNPNVPKEELEQKVAKYMKNQNKNLLDNIRDKNEIKFEYFGNKAKAMDKATYKQLLMDTIDDIINAETKEKAKCNKTKLPLRLKRSEYLQTEGAKAKKILIEIENKLNNIKDVKIARQILKEQMKKLKLEKANPELIAILSEIRDRSAGAGESKFYKVQNWFKNLFGEKINTKTKANNDTVMLDKMKSKISKIMGHIEKYSTLKTKEEVKLSVLKSLTDRKNELDNSISFLAKIKKAIIDGKKLSIIESMFTKEIESSAEHRLSDVIFGERVIEKFKNNIEKNLKGYKAITGLLVSFAMLPVSCSLLNWSYPRFMDAVFPNLSNKKHTNVSKELIEKADKNSEVKS